MDIRGRRSTPEAPKLGLAKAPPKQKQAKLKAARTSKQRTREHFVGPKAPKQVRQRVAKRLKKAAKKSQGGLAKKLDRPFGPDEKITPRQTAIVAESEGLPGITYAKAIAPGESNYRPGVPNPDDATPSLFQITPSVQSAATQAKFDRIASKRPGGYSNPIVAAKQAKVLAKESPDAGVSNYVAYNPSAPQGHLPGGPQRARKILYGKDKPIPKKLERKAERVLGEKRSAEIVKKATKPTAAPTLAGATKLKPDQRQTLKAMVKEATRIDKTNHPYEYGGAHVAGKVPGPKKTNYDCSSVTSRILQKAGVLPKSSGALVSGDFMNYGDPGPGTVTIFANDGHVFMRIGNKYFGTSSQDNTGSGGFLRESTGAAEAASGEYTVRHVPELGKAKIGLKGLPSFPGVSFSEGGTTATVTSSTTLTTPGSSSKPITPAKRKAKRIAGRKRSQTIRKLIAEGPAEVPVPEVTRTTTPYSERVKKTPIKLGL